MDVAIYDEKRDQYATLNLSPEDYDRIKTDQTYLAELLRIHYANTEALITPTTNDHPNEENLLLTNIIPVETGGNEDQNRSIFIWSNACIYLLLSLYEETGEDWKFKRHKKIYDDIAANMRSTNPNYTVNGSQCQSKMASLKKHYKKINDHNGRSGNNRMTWPYFERMDQLFGNKGWVRPPAAASEAGPSQEEAPSIREPRKKQKIENIMQELAQSRKERQEERKDFFNKFLEMKKQQHEEKMNILKEICQNLSNNK